MVFAPEVLDVLERVQQWCVEATPARRMVLDHLEVAPGIEGLVDHSTRNLAEVALALWPAWYGDSVRLPDPRLPATDFKRQLGEELAEWGLPRREVLLSWAWKASRLCQAGKPPRPEGIPFAVQVAQLALAIEPRDLLIVLGVESAGLDHLLGLARGAEWLARETAARLLVVVPDSLAGSAELDGINFGAVHWTKSDDPARLGESIPDERTARVWPTVGKPHPFSPGEQLLATRLAEDPELSGIFSHNAFVRSRFGRSFLIDLLWEAGRLVVEIDGYRHHSGRLAFAADRQRDYELTLSGYLILRLPHDEVLADTELALEKIRNFVQFRRSQGPLEG